MTFTKDEKAMLEFAMRYPDQWHSFSSDVRTIKAVYGLYRKIESFIVDIKNSSFRYARKKAWSYKPFRNNK